MCGRFSNQWPRSRWEAVLGPLSWVGEGPEPSPHFAPGDRIWVWTEPGQVRAMRWGWQADWLGGRLLINARAETAASRPTFRPYVRQRGLVLADAFYEWQHLAQAKPRPYRLARADGEPLLLAALWRRTDSLEEAAVILTEPMFPALSWLHDRQPVAIGLAQALAWLAGALPMQRVSSEAISGWDAEPVESSWFSRWHRSAR
ncbi:MAG: SOS response-associated peptidase [Firmicutes bacterium]|nr:SOS response-associated peptidase [Bacillota bacterium]